MVLKKTVLFLFLFVIIKSFSQPKVETSLTDSISSHFYSNPKKASELLNVYIKRNKKSDNINNLVSAYASLAILHELMNNIDSTLFYYYKSLSLVDKPIDVIQYKYSIAKIYRDEYKYKDALLLYNQIYDLARKENMTNAIDRINLTMVSMKNGLVQSEETIKGLELLYNKEKKNKEKNIRYTRKKIIEFYLQGEKTEGLDSLIQEGIKEALATNNKEFLYYMHYFNSKLNIINKEYSKAKNNAELAIENAKLLQNKKFIDEANFRLAEVYFGTNNYEDALYHLKRIEQQAFSEKPNKLSKYYRLIANTYAELDSSKKSNRYFVKHIEEKDKASKKRLEALESIHDISLKEQATNLQNSYGEELQEEISKKEKYKKTKWLWTGVSGVLLALIVGVFFFFKKKSKVNQKRFDDLMVKINAFEEKKLSKKPEIKEDLKKQIKADNQLSEAIDEKNNGVTDSKELINQGNHQKVDSVYTIDDKKVQQILNKLQILEDKMYFLRQDCTMHNMAKKLKTNTSYLSKIINTHLDKSFSTYINELRINHAILELKNNRRLRSYSVKGIAQEMGYKNADAFSRYFRAATGISPSVYIKKIEEI